jgi:predicted nuclease of predicted toxin-antitoxin system
MRFLAHENFPKAAVEALSSVGHDVVWVRKEAPGLADNEVLAWAGREQRILVIFDKDFGELARSARMPKTCGVILFRIPMPNREVVGDRLATIISARSDWAGHLSVMNLVAFGCVQSRIEEDDTRWWNESGLD